MELNRDFSEFIACFVARDVRFLVVGGYALAARVLDPQEDSMQRVDATRT
jgi:hypothetical protein